MPETCPGGHPADGAPCVSYKCERTKGLRGGVCLDFEHGGGRRDVFKLTEAGPVRVAVMLPTIDCRVPLEEEEP